MISLRTSSSPSFGSLDHADVSGHLPKLKTTQLPDNPDLGLEGEENTAWAAAKAPTGETKFAVGSNKKRVRFFK